MTVAAKNGMTRALLVVFVAAFAVRLLPFIIAPSLYLDEAMLGLSVATRDFAGLTRPLDFEQSAPVLFLWLQRLAVAFAGVTEHTLRILPFLAGLVLAPLTWLVARDLGAPRAALLATALAAMSPLAVWYANVAKPYAVDAAAGSALLLLAVPVLQGRGSRVTWTALAATGTVATLVSAPSVFLLSGVLLALVVRFPLWKPGVPRGRVIAVGLVLVIAIGLNYFVFQRQVAGDAYLQRFYARAFLWPLDATLPQRISEIVSGMTQLFFFGRRAPVPSLLLAVTVGLCLIGFLPLHRRHGWPITTLFAAPFAAVVVAAMLRKYPPVERLLLFMTPILVILAAGGLFWLTERLPARWRAAGFITAAALLLAPAGVYDVRNALDPHGEGAEVGPILAEYERGRQSGDPVYVYSRAVPVWAYYTTNWARPDLDRLSRLLDAAHKIGPNSGNAPTRGRPVQREGFDLVITGRDRQELVGIAPGVEILYGSGGSQRLTPDPGWAENEVARMRETAAPRVWVFLSHHSTEVARDLEAAIQRGGGVITADWRDWGVRLWSVSFTPPPERTVESPRGPSDA